MPVGGVQTSSTPFIPIDSVFQAQDQSVVHVADKGVVKSKTVQLGQVMGQFVEIIQGLSNGDQVILNRNVIDGDKVKVI